MDAKQQNEIDYIYKNLMEKDEQNLYLIDNIDYTELLKYKNNKIYMIQLILDNLSKSKNILKNYEIIIFISKKYGMDKLLNNYVNDIFNMFKNEFNSFIEKLKDIKGKNIHIKENEMMIDNIPYKMHMDIRITFLEIIYKDIDISYNKDLYNFIKEEILVPKKLVNVRDKIRLIDLVNKKYNNKDNLINELIKKLFVEDIKLYDINDLLFYEYLFLEDNYKKNNLDYKEKINEKSCNISFEIISIKRKADDLLNINYYKDLFYNQEESDIINEMSIFLFKLYNLTHKANILYDYNKKKLLEDQKMNGTKLFKCIIEENEKYYLSKHKSHFSLSKKNIFKINGFYFFGNTKVDEINNYLLKNYPNIYYGLNLLINKEERALDLSETNKTLNELKDNNMYLKIYKKEIIKDNLYEDHKLTKKFNDVLEFIFKLFSNNKEIMDKNGVSKFISKVTQKYYGPDNFKVKDFFRKNADSKDLIKKKDFLNYYTNKCKDNIGQKLIWDNIKNLNYYPDLTKIKEVESPKKFDIKYNIRFRLSNKKINKNKEYMIYELKEKYKKSLEKEIFDLILFLSTNTSIYNNVLDNFNSKNDLKLTNNYDDYIDNMYTLIIIESIFEDIELKDNKKYNNLNICSEKYTPFDNEENDGKKKKFSIDFFKNNYSDLLDYITEILKRIYSEEKNRNEIIIRCCLKGFEIINNIYNGYYKINYEEENENNFMIKLSMDLIKENKLEKYIEDHALYNNLINQILNFILKIYSINEKENNKYMSLLVDNCYYLLFSLLYTNEDIYKNYINDNEENKKLLSQIILNILTADESEKNSEYINKLFISFFNNNEKKIPLDFISLLINITFSIFEDNNLDKYKILLKQFFSKYLSNLCVYAVNNEKYIELKTKLLKIYEETYKYIKSKSKDIKKEDNKDSLYSNYLLVLIKCLDKLENLRKEIIYNKYDDETLYDLLMKIFNIEIEKRIENITKKYKYIDDLVKDNDQNKFVSYDKVLEAQNKISELNNINYGKKNNLLKEMISYCSFNLSSENNINEINKIILQLKEMKKIDEDNLKLSKKNNDDKRKKHKKKYPGLKNLGNICYLNSVIQQLFMIPQFRYSIMGIDDKKDKIKTEILDDDNTLHQLQRMFTYLLFTYYGDFIPKDFILSLKDPETNQTEQQDAQEFYSNLCDKIERLIDNTEQKYLINNLFMGKTCYMNKCTVCGYVSYNFDKFKNLSLEIEGCMDIFQSLKKYNTIDNIEDYKCPNCQKTVTLEKTAFLSSLPNILIIHLKRIVMNYAEDKIQKINSRFEFPTSLDLKEYCIENAIENEEDGIYKKKDEYYQYKLKGVNIHKGNAEGGHYVSIINMGNDENNKDKNENKDKWFQFDDSRVKEFNIENLEEECFGGNKKDSNEEISKSAYLLIYELSKKKPMKIMINENEIENSEDTISFDNSNSIAIKKEYNVIKLKDPYDEKELVKKIFYNKDDNSYYKFISYDSVTKNIPKEYLDEVFKDNKLYDYLNGINRVIDFNNYLLEIIIKCFETSIININDFDALINLIDICISGIISSLSNYNIKKNVDNDNAQNIIPIIKKIIMPSLKNDNDKEKVALLNLINNNLFNINNIKLIFNTKTPKEISKQVYELLLSILKINTKESNEKLFISIYKIINEEKDISFDLYNILYESCKNKYIDNVKLLKEIFMILYYKIYDENIDNLKIIGKIFNYLIYEENILLKDPNIIREIKNQFNERILKILFDSSLDILILFTKQLQYNDEKYTDEFNKKYIQKLYTYVESNHLYDDKIKLVKLIYGILEIIDKYTCNRIQMLLGYPTLIMKQTKENILPILGVGLMNNDINQEIFKYINYNHIRKEKCILAILFPSSDRMDNSYILEENDRLDLIYELIKISLGFNEKNQGNYFLFKYIYLMQSRKICYENLYVEIQNLLETANNNNNKYDLSILKSNEKQCIKLVKFEIDELYYLINLTCKIDPYLEDDKKYIPKPELPECFNSCKEFLNDKISKDFYGLLSYIIPHEIGKININLTASNDSLSIIRFEYYTTYFTKRELLSLAEDQKEFIYENVKRENYDDESMNKNGDDEPNIMDFSIFNNKKNEKEFILYIDNILKESGAIVIENNNILGKKAVKNCLVRYYILSKKKNNVMRIKSQKLEMSKDIENNFYIPDMMFDSVKQNQFNNIINIHRMNYKFKFMNIKNIGINFISMNYDKYFNDYIN